MSSSMAPARRTPETAVRRAPGWRHGHSDVFGDVSQFLGPVVERQLEVVGGSLGGQPVLPAVTGLQLDFEEGVGGQLAEVRAGGTFLGGFRQLGEEGEAIEAGARPDSSPPSRRCHQLLYPRSRQWSPGTLRQPYGQDQAHRAPAVVGEAHRRPGKVQEAVLVPLPGASAKPSSKVSSPEISVAWSEVFRASGGRRWRGWFRSRRCGRRGSP